MKKSKLQQPSQQHTCSECAHLSEKYDIGANGKPILGRCPHSRYAFLLKEAACEKFKASP